MPADDAIGAAKTQIMVGELATLLSEFQRTGNLTVNIAYTDGDWLSTDGKTGHAQLVLTSGTEKLVFGFSPTGSHEDLKATFGADVPGVFAIEDLDANAIQSSNFVFNGAAAAHLIDDVAAQLASQNQTYHTIFNSCITAIHNIVRDYGINVYTLKDELLVAGPIGLAFSIPDTGSKQGYIITDSFEGPNQEIHFYKGDGSQVDALTTNSETGLSWWDTTGQLRYNAGADAELSFSIIV